MIQTLLSREDIAKRWGVTVRTVISYEADGVITRIPSIPVPRYNIEEILKVEGTDFNPLSPMERRRLEKELEYYKDKVMKIQMVLQ